MELHAGSLLQGGRYRVERTLGQGGFGITYLGTQIYLSRKVAIKEFFMDGFCMRDTTQYVTAPTDTNKGLVESFRRKFIKEAQNIAKLKHPNIVSIIDVFEDNGTAYYVMESLDGGSLLDKVEEGALPEEKALKYIRQVAAALEYIHGNSMMHLDIKPANILLDSNDNAVVIDFGLAKQYDNTGQQTSTTPVGISHGYAPIEQYSKNGVGTFSPSTDIYSLGATLFKLITGATPPEANRIYDEGLPPLPQHISAETRAAIEAAMQPRRKDRPQNVAEFLAYLKEPVLKPVAAGVAKDAGTTVVQSGPARQPGNVTAAYLNNTAKPESKKSLLWLWILLAVLGAALSVLLFFYITGGEEKAAIEVEVAAPAPANAEPAIPVAPAVTAEPVETVKKETPVTVPVKPQPKAEPKSDEPAPAPATAPAAKKTVPEETDGAARPAAASKKKSSGMKLVPVSSGEKKPSSSSKKTAVKSDKTLRIRSNQTYTLE